MSLKVIIENIIKENELRSISRIITSAKNKELLLKVIERTNFLDENVKIMERIYCIMNDIYSPILCKECKKNKVKFKGYGKGGYREFCSISCSRSNSETQEKYKQTSIERYGVENPNQLQEVKDKKLKTIKKNHNVNNYSELYNLKEIKEERERTNQERYNSKYPSQSEKVKKKIKDTNNKRYGKDSYFQTEEFKEYLKNKMKKEYGVTSYTQTQEYREKTRKKSLEKYNTKHPTQSQIVKDKIKKTNNERHGVDYPYQNLEILKKVRESTKKNKGYYCIFEDKNERKKMEEQNEKLYGNKNLGSIGNLKRALSRYKNKEKEFNIEIKIDNENLGYKVHCKKCNNSFLVNSSHLYDRMIRYNLTPCYTCLPKNSLTSGIEQKVGDFIKEIYKENGEIIFGDRKILEGKEIDILLPEANLGIEINGLYWHNDSKGKDKNYHLEKTKKAKEKGIQLIHLFDDEIEQGIMLIYSILTNKGLLKKDLYDDKKIEDLNEEYHIELTKPRKIYARKLKLRSIIESKKGEKKKYKEILKKYHIQGDDNAKYYYILEKENENGKNIPLSIMTFKKMSVDKNQIKENGNIQTFELSRYVTIPGIQIVGGFQKLLKAFKKDISKEYNNMNIKLLTYSNLRYSDEDNNVYIRNGFKKVGFTGVNYYYFYEGRKYHRFKFRKDQLYYKYLPEYGIPVDPDYKKESEAGMIEKMRNNGIQVNKIFDCGHIKWEMDLI